MNVLDEVLQSITYHKNELVAVVVHLNDTYLIEERRHRNLPGFARIIATVKRLRAHVEEVTGSNRVLVVHSGDFLSPSLLAQKDHGKAMVELLNRAGVNYCLLGNHEFDDGAEVLADRLREAKFTVLLANATDPTRLIAGGKVARGVFWPEDDRNPPALVALTGVVSADVHESFESPDPDPFGALVPGRPRKWKWSFVPPNEALIEFLKTASKIPFRIVLTHATQNEDRLLRRQIPETPRTYILGGHDHDIEWVEDNKDVYVMKNLANAETVRVLLLLAGGESVTCEVYATYERLAARRREAGKTTPQYPRDLEAVLLGTSDVDSKVVKHRIENPWPVKKFKKLEEALFSTRYATDILAYKLRYGDHEAAAPDDAAYVEGALKAVADQDDGLPVCDLSSKTAKLEARDAHIRRHQTNLGVFVAECIRLEAAALVAIINSGAFRCDSELDAKLSVRDLPRRFYTTNQTRSWS